MADHSPIRAKGVGKDSKRHDLDGTPGLDSDLQYGEVQVLEAGQKVLRDTQQTQTVPVTGQPVPPAGQGQMQVPDAVSFAKQKLAGTLDKAGFAGQTIQQKDHSGWMPLLERLATSPTSSGLLQSAYIRRLSSEMSKPLGGSMAVLRQREFDKRLDEL